MIKFDKTIFEVNKKLTVTLLEIGNEKNRLLEVENFFKYPERVRNFLNNIPIQNIKDRSNNSTNIFPGYQIELMYDFNDLNVFFNKAYKLAFNASLTQETISKFTYQCIDGNESIRNLSNFPHIDPALFASNIFLNYDIEIGEDSGTAFYRNKISGNEYMPINPMNNSMYRYNRDIIFNSKMDYNTKYAPIINNDDWEMYYISRQKFNKLNLYEGALYHNAFMKINTFTTTPRTSLSVFLLNRGY